MQNLWNNLKALIYFILFGFIVYIWAHLRAAKKIALELNLANYKFKKEEVKNEVSKEDINKLIDDLNKSYKSGE